MTEQARQVDDDAQASTDHELLKIKQIVEAALLASAEPLNLNQLAALFADDGEIEHSRLREALALLDEDCTDRGVELQEVASGYRLQVRENLQTWISRLWEQKPRRYSRALLETLALIAYRQPLTRAEIEDVRGVSVSTHIIRTLEEREWIRVVGHRDVPGKPALFGTTKAFLDYFNLKSLDQLPTLAEIKEIDNPEPELELVACDQAGTDAGTDEGGEAGAAKENETTAGANTAAKDADQTAPTDELADAAGSAMETEDIDAETDDDPDAANYPRGNNGEVDVGAGDDNADPTRPGDADGDPDGVNGP